MKKCPNCGAEYDEFPAPKFCNFCGTPLPEDEPAPDKAAGLEAEPTFGEMEDPADATQPLRPEDDPLYYRSAPAPVPQENPVNERKPKKEKPAKQGKGRGGLIAATIILAVFVAAFGAFGVLAGLEIHDDRALIDEQYEELNTGATLLENIQSQIDDAQNKVTSMEGQLDDKDREIADLNTDLQNKEEEIAQLQADADELSGAADIYAPMLEEYESLFDYAEDCSFGWASGNFHGDFGVVTLQLDGGTASVDFNLTFKEEAENPITVSWEVSNDHVEVKCNEDALEEVTPFTLTASKPGMSLVQFTNNYNSEAFNILVLVYD